MAAPSKDGPTPSAAAAPAPDAQLPVATDQDMAREFCDDALADEAGVFGIP